MAFCTIEDVVALTKPNPPYSATSTPNEGEVQGFIDKINAMMRLRLRSAGYRLPITDPEDLKYLKMVNSFGAGSLAEEALSGANNNEVNSVAEDLWKKFISELTAITKGDITLTGMGPTRVPRALHTSFVADGSDPEISDNTPMFRRDTTF